MQLEISLVSPLKTRRITVATSLAIKNNKRKERKQYKK
jgi:hypothetical protein